MKIDLSKMTPCGPTVYFSKVGRKPADEPKDDARRWARCLRKLYPNLDVAEPDHNLDCPFLDYVSVGPFDSEEEAEAFEKSIPRTWPEE